MLATERCGENVSVRVNAIAGFVQAEAEPSATQNESSRAKVSVKGFLSGFSLGPDWCSSSCRLLPSKQNHTRTHTSLSTIHAFVAQTQKSYFAKSGCKGGWREGVCFLAMTALCCC